MEKIERAAIWHKGLVYSVRRPGRHDDVIRVMAKRPNHKAADTRHQGFTTDAGRFVDRKEALVIARIANQVIEKHGNPLELYSEDVW